MVQSPDLFYKKFLKIQSSGELLFYRRVEMFVEHFIGSQNLQIIVFKLVPDGSSFRIKIIKHFTFNRNLGFSPASLNNDLTTITLTKTFNIKTRKHSYILVILVSIDLNRIESPDFRVKEDLVLLPEMRFHHITIDDGRRIYMNNLSRGERNIFKELFRAEYSCIPRMPLGLETALLDFFSLRSEQVI